MRTFWIATVLPYLMVAIMETGMITLHTGRTFSLFAVIELLLGVILFFAQRIFGITAGSSTFNYMILGIIGGGTIMTYGIFFNLLKGGKLQWFVRDREMPE